MVSLVAVVVSVVLITAMIGGLYIFYELRSEKFQPGYELERTIGGYGATLGDKRTMAAQNFGIDDGLAGVFSARILTPWDSYAMRRRNRNMRMAQSAECDLVCRPAK
jgi:hypothetical protein